MALLSSTSPQLEPLNSSGLPTRRRFIETSLLSSLALLFPNTNSVVETPKTKHTVSPSLVNQYLDKSVDFLKEARHPNGLYYDLVSPEKGSLHANRCASLAGTGFGLASLVVACSEGLMDFEKAYQDASQTLLFTKAISRPEYHGWLPHFANPTTGAPEVSDKFTGNVIAPSEISSIDTALFMLGALAAGEFFKGNVQSLAQELFHKIDFEYLLNDKLQFGHGFYCNQGQNEKINCHWDTDSEGPLVALLALGSDQKIDSQVWTNAWERSGKEDFPLFVYYYPVCFLDLKDQTDALGFNFWERASKAIKYQAGLDQHWGFSACMFPGGGYSENSPSSRVTEKVIAPTATLACLPIEKELVEQQIASWQFEACRFGLPGSVILNPQGQPIWKSEFHLTIDHFSTLCMLDTARGGAIHRASSESIILKQSMRRAGFQKPELDKYALQE